MPTSAKKHWPARHGNPCAQCGHSRSLAHRARGILFRGIARSGRSDAAACDRDLPAGARDRRPVRRRRHHRVCRGRRPRPQGLQNRRHPPRHHRRDRAAGELEPILRPHATYRAIRICPSRKARPRDRWERDLARERAFGAYFKDARRAEIELDRLTFQRALLFTGEPIALAGAIYAEHTADGVIAGAERPLVSAEVAKWLKAGFERSLLCGVADENDRGIGLAVLESINFAGAACR
jgi:hypothetical protein